MENLKNKTFFASQQIYVVEIIIITIKKHLQGMKSSEHQPLSIIGHQIFKVAIYMYLQGCLASKRCSTSGLSCRYLNPYIKLKLVKLVIKLHVYQEF